MVAEEVPDDIVVAPAVHSLQHGFVGFDAKALVVEPPRLAVDGVRIDGYTVHIQNDGHTPGQHGTRYGMDHSTRFSRLLAAEISHEVPLPSSSGNWPTPP